MSADANDLTVNRFTNITFFAEPGVDERADAHSLGLADINQVAQRVMGTVGCSGIPGSFVSDVAEETFDQAYSVPAVKPRDFASPVTAGSTS